MKVLERSILKNVFADTFPTVLKLNISVALSFRFDLKDRNANLGAELRNIETKQQDIEGKFNFEHR